MMVINWSDINSVNVKEMDEQHKQLVAMINDFFQSTEKDKAALVRLADELNDYANYHLSNEERYFDEFHYELAAEHKAQHQQYREKIAEFRRRIEADDLQLVLAELSAFLRDWWIFHINKIDLQYADCFNDHGLY